MIGRISRREEIAKDTLRVEFDISPERINFKAGQYFFITLKNPLFDDPRGNTRHFSLVNSPKQQDKIIMTTRLTGSGFKKSLAELPLGTEVLIGSIEGDFTLPKDFEQPLLLIAGGIGITPFMSMLEVLKDKRVPATLLYSNRNKDSTAYFKELEKLSAGYSFIRVIFTMTDDSDWKGETGRIDAKFIKSLSLDLNSTLAYIAGPPGMVKALNQALLQAGMNKDRIKVENFTGYQ